MPELAEVEYFRKRWDPGIGDAVVAVQMHSNKRIFRGTDARLLKERLVRQKLRRSEARGKQMIFIFSGQNWLGIHLGMSGALRVEGPNFRAGLHDHLVLLQKRRALVFEDTRQFGRVRFHHGKDAPDWWQKSPPEIVSVEFNLAAMRRFVRRHGKAPIKASLLMQAGFPGIGNWMADEVLWRAHIAPQRKGDSLKVEEFAALWRSVRFVARASLQRIGRDNSEVPKGWLLHDRWRVGGKCPRHRTDLRREKIGGRTTAWCPRCQR
jgi:formamidopyrimidine-DNA glycosylase